VKTISDLACAIAGWWSLGIGVVPISILIGFIWSCVESVMDIVDLLDGKTVAVLKTEGDWKTDLDGLLGMTDVAEEVEGLSGYGFEYEDYLRLLLYLPFTSEEAKLLRIMDLAQINIGNERDEAVDFSEYIHDLETTGSVEMNPLFMQLPFMPELLKAAFGETVLNIEGYYCYQ
jgi:hypothetical protein